ncbi:hypothetical protein H0H93_007895, partial [Arthromyces matolae]
MKPDDDSVQDAQRHGTPAIVHPELKHPFRKHVRTIYKEVSVSVNEIWNYKTEARVPSDMTDRAARYLRLAGSVHRDISAGNCLWDGKLSDLEYARPYTESVGHDPRTVPPAFMAAEYLQGLYQFTFIETASGDLKTVLAQAKILAKETVADSGPFASHRTRFNFYHDLESIFWIYIWFLHHRLPKKLMQTNPDLTPLKESAETLFLNVIAANPSRTELIFARDASAKLLHIFTPIYTLEFEILFASIPMPVILASAYRSLELTAPQAIEGLWDENKFDAGLHACMKGEFDAMVAAMKNKRISTDFNTRLCSVVNSITYAFMEKLEGMIDDTQRHATQPTIVHPELEHARKHVLLTYKEVSLSASEICNYKTAARVPSDMTDRAARYLRLAGSVHRDISAGNCLWDGNLSDLEYARPYTESVGHDPRTGTPAFMAAEYLQGLYQFTLIGTASGDRKTGLAQAKILAKEKQQASSPLVSHRPRFNFYHDLESIFWIYIWFLHHRLPKKLMQSNPDLTSLKESAETLFLNVIAANPSRTELIFEGDASVRLLNILAPIYTPEFEILFASIPLRVLLASAYMSLELTAPQAVEGFWDKNKFQAWPYADMKEEFDAMVAATKVDSDYEAEVLFFDLKREAST